MSCARLAFGAETTKPTETEGAEAAPAPVSVTVQPGGKPWPSTTAACSAAWSAAPPGVPGASEEAFAPVASVSSPEKEAAVVVGLGVAEGDSEGDGEEEGEAEDESEDAAEAAAEAEVEAEEEAEVEAEAEADGVGRSGSEIRVAEEEAEAEAEEDAAGVLVPEGVCTV